jgi:hypothetical protein
MTGPAKAQNSADTAVEREGVVAAALDYMQGALTVDAERMARGVHPELTKVVISTMRQTGRQVLRYNTATTLVEWVRAADPNRMAELDQNVDVTVFDISNDMAVARAIGQIWYDFLQLAKINGQWRIVHVLWASNRLQAEDQTGVQPEPEDRAAIEETALNYIDGAFSGDGDRMARALHPEITKMMLAERRETGMQYLRKMGPSHLIEGTHAGLGTLAEEERNIEVEIYDVSHGIAAVKVSSAMYIDHLQVGKFNGEWKIINVLWVPNPDRPRQGG